MKTIVEKKKKEFQKTIDKSQNLMYNKYVRLRERKSLDAYRWGSSCDLATAGFATSDPPRNNLKMPRQATILTSSRCGGTADTADSKSAA